MKSLFRSLVFCALGTFILSQPTTGRADPLDTWTVAASGTTNNLNAITCGSGLFVAVGDAGTVLTSADGGHWGVHASGVTNALTGVTFGAGRFVAIGGQDTVVVSTDGTNWLTHTTGTGADLKSICYGAGKFAVVGYKGLSHSSLISVSADGASWAQSYSLNYDPFSTSYILEGIAFGNGHFEVVGNGQEVASQNSFPASEVLTSTDATNWVKCNFQTEYSVGGLTYGNGQFFAATWATGNSVYFYSSSDATNWLLASHFPTVGAGVTHAVAAGKDSHSNDLVVDAQWSGNFLTGTGIGTSNDAWNSHSVPFNLYNSAVYGLNAAGTGVFVAVAPGGGIIFSTIYTGAFTWTNTAGGNWSNPANWSPNEVPGFGDDALITVPGTYTVNIDIPTVNLRSLTLGAGGSGTQTLTMTNNTMYVNPLIVTAGGVLNASGATFHAVATVQNGGVINTANGIFYVNPLTIGNAGTYNANGDTLHQITTIASGGAFNLSNSAVVVDSDGSLAVAGGGTINLAAYLYLYGPATNSGTLNMNGNNWIYIFNNGTASYQGGLVNEPAGQINLLSSGGFGTTSYGHEFLINRGLITKPYSGGSTIDVSLFDNSSGTVSNLAGTLNLGRFVGVLAGTYDVEAGASIHFNGGTPAAPLIAGSPLVLGGPGQYFFSSGALRFPTDIIPNLILADGSLDLGAGFQGGAITNLTLQGTTLTNTLPVTGTLNVTNSPMYGNLPVQSGGVLNANGVTFDSTISVAAGAVMNIYGGSVTIASDGWLNIAGQLNMEAYLYLYGPATNIGTINVDGNNYIYIYNNGTAAYPGGLVNRAAGRINLLSSGGIGTTGYGYEYLINQGSIVKSAYGGSSSISISIFDNNTGTITNLGGTLNVGNFANVLSGAYDAEPGSVIQFSAGTAANPVHPGTPLLMAGTGRYAFISGVLNLPTDIVPGLILSGGVLELGSGFQGGAITNLALAGTTLTNTLPVKGPLNVTNSTIYGTFAVQNGGVLNASSVTFDSRITVASSGVMNLYGGSTTIASDGWLTVAGELNMAAYLYLYGPMTNAGTVNVNGNNSIYIYNNGTANYPGGLVNLPAGQLNLLSIGGIGTTAYGYEYFINQGLVTKGPDPRPAEINVSHFTNQGSIVAQNGVLLLARVNLDPVGSLGARLNSPSDYGQITILGDAALNGTFSIGLNNSFVPVPGNSFNVLNFGSASGIFSGVNFPSASGLTWHTNYTSTAFSVQVNHVPPQFLAAQQVGTQLIFSGTNGPSGGQYRVLASPDVQTPTSSWLAIATNSFNGDGTFRFTNNISAGIPRQFYLLQLLP